MKFVGSFMHWNKDNCSQNVFIFREVCSFSMLKLKSPVIIMSDMPVSIARCIESSIPE